MAEATKFIIGVDARCSDGPCGHMIRVVYDPVAQTVTHLVVEPAHRQGLGKLVPLDLVDDATVSDDSVQLRCTLAEFGQLPPAEATQFLPGAEVEGATGIGGYPAGHALSWPYYQLGQGVFLGAGNVDLPIVYDTVPLGEVAVHRGQPVHATDGDIGHVEGLVIEPESHHVTHVLLQEGHLFGRKEVAIPISAVTQQDDAIGVNLTKAEVQDLPSVEIAGRAG